jgi:hypothetical protein
VTQLDPRSGRTVLRVPRVGDIAGAGENALAADEHGAWVVNPGKGSVLHVENGRVIRRIVVGERLLPVLGRSGNEMWVASQDAPRGGYRLTRIDAESGTIAAAVDLGTHRPSTLVPASGGLWVVAADGTALRVQADQP